MIDVLIADDHAVVRDGIKAIVNKKSSDINIVAEVKNGKELLREAKRKTIDIYLVDVSMPVLNGIEAVCQLRKLLPKSKVIMLSMHDDRTFLEKVLTYGVQGYILKENATEEVIRAIRDVYEEKSFFSVQVKKYVSHKFRGKKDSYQGYEIVTKLTKKERQILQLIAEGYSNKEMANHFKISDNTVHVHRNNIMRKLNIHKQANLIRYAIKEGIASL